VDDYICLENENTSKVLNILSILVEPLELIKYSQGNKVQYLKTISFIEEGKLFYKFFFKDSCILSDYRSIQRKEIKANTVTQYARNIKMVCDKKVNLHECNAKL
jgi:hypothetical protein